MRCTSAVALWLAIFSLLGDIAPAGAQPPGPPPRPAPAPAEPTFTVFSFVFEENAAISTGELQKLAAPYLRKPVTITLLKRMAREMEGVYEKRGFVLAKVLIPQQSTSLGTLRIVVREGRYGEVKVVGNDAYSAHFVKRMFGRALREKAIRQNAIEHALLVTNEFPDLRVRSYLSPGQKPGTTDVTLKVEDRMPLHAGIDYNNYGNRLVGRNRVGFNLWAGNVLTEGDEFVGRIIEPFPTDSDPFYQAGYTFPVGDDGARLSFQYASAATVVGGGFQVLNLEGEADVFSLTWSLPLVRELTRSTNVAVGVISKSIENRALGVTTSRDELRMVNASHDGTYIRGKGQTYHIASATVGLGNALGGRGDDPVRNPIPSRVGVSNEFGHANVDVVHTQRLDDKDFVVVRGSGQVASDRLPVAEQFALGGPDSVRGFIQSEFLGDHGYSVSAEFRRTVMQRTNLNLQCAAFVDHGHASIEDTQPGEVGNRTMTGVGAGMRANVGRHVSSRVDVGFPISSDKNVQGDDAVLYAQLVSRW